MGFIINRDLKISIIRDMYKVSFPPEVDPLGRTVAELAFFVKKVYFFSKETI